LNIDDCSKMKYLTLWLLARQFNSTAEAVDVHVYTFPNVHGTQFVNHQRSGVRVLLHNWVPLIQAIENAVASQNKQQNTKLLGMLNRLRDVCFLAAACLFKVILDVVAPFSLKLEEGNIFVFDAVPAMLKMKSDLEPYSCRPVKPSYPEVTLSAG